MLRYPVDREEFVDYNAPVTLFIRGKHGKISHNK
jgi:hypothetical protein